MEGDDELGHDYRLNESPQHQFRIRQYISVYLGTTDTVDLSNEAWSHGSVEDVRRDRRLILEKFVEGRWGRRTTVTWVHLGYHFLRSIGPVLPNDGDSTMHLRTTLHAIGNMPNLRTFVVVGLPSSPETINTQVLLESMASFQNDLEFLGLADLEFRRKSEVQALADLLGSRGGALAKLCLKGLIPAINDGMAGFLDPILLAMTLSSGSSYRLPPYFELSGGDGASVSRVTLISETALRRVLPCVDFDAGMKGHCT